MGAITEGQVWMRVAGGWRRRREGEEVRAKEWRWIGCVEGGAREWGLMDRGGDVGIKKGLWEAGSNGTGA